MIMQDDHDPMMMVIMIMMKVMFFIMVVVVILMKMQNQNRSSLPCCKFKANKLGTFQLVKRRPYLDDGHS